MSDGEMKTWKNYFWNLIVSISIAYYATYVIVIGVLLTAGYLHDFVFADKIIKSTEIYHQFTLIYFIVGLAVVTFFLPIALLLGVPLWLVVYKYYSSGWTKNRMAARRATFMLVGLTSGIVLTGLSMTYTPSLILSITGLFSLAVLFIVGLMASQVLINRAMQYV